MAVAEVRCVDGTVLRVQPVPVLGRDDVPYEVTLRLLAGDAVLGEVGERCGWFLAEAAERVRAAVAAGDDVLPASSLEAGLRAWAADTGADPDTTWQVLQRYLPRDRELFAFRARDPDDLAAAAGELRVWLRDERTWVTELRETSKGRWRVRCRAVLDACGADGRGLRAVLTCRELLDLLDALVQECAGVGVPYRERARTPAPLR